MESLCFRVVFPSVRLVWGNLNSSLVLRRHLTKNFFLNETDFICLSFFPPMCKICIKVFFKANVTSEYVEVVLKYYACMHPFTKGNTSLLYFLVLVCDCARSTVNTALYVRRINNATSPRQQLGDSHNANKVKVNTGQPVLEINVGTGASKNIIIIQSYLVGSTVQGRARCSVDRKQLINSVAFSLLGRKDIHMYKVILSEPTRYWSVVVYWLENN